jgi:hypothetical protein
MSRCTEGSCQEARRAWPRFWALQSQSDPWLTPNVLPVKTTDEIASRFADLAEARPNATGSVAALASGEVPNAEDLVDWVWPNAS